MSKTKSKNAAAMKVKENEELFRNKQSETISEFRVSRGIKTRGMTLSEALSPSTRNMQIENAIETDQQRTVIEERSVNNALESISDRVHARPRRSPNNKTEVLAVDKVTVDNGEDQQNAVFTNTPDMIIPDTVEDIVLNNVDVIYPLTNIEIIDIFKENFVFPAVRGLPSSNEVQSLFVKVIGLLIIHMRVMSNKHTMHMKRSIFAFNFLPCIMRYKRGQRHNTSIIRDLNLIIGIDSFDTIENNGFFNGVETILKFRKEWILRNSNESNRH